MSTPQIPGVNLDLAQLHFFVIARIQESLAGAETLLERRLLTAALRIVGADLEMMAAVDFDGCEHTCDDIAAGLCPEVFPVDMQGMLIFAEVWSTHPEYDPRWTRWALS